MPPDTSKQLEMILFVRGTLLGVPVEVTAEYRSDGPLRFTATLPPGSRLELADLVEALPLGGFRLPPGLPRLALENLALSFESGSSAFALSGDVPLGLEQRFSLMGVNFQLPSGASLHVSLVRLVPTDGAASTTLALDLNVPGGEGFVLSSNLAWARELAGSTLREVQNDEKERQEDLVSLSLSSADPLEMTLVEMTFEPSPVTTYFSDFQVTDAPDDDVSLDLRFALNIGDGFDFPFLNLFVKIV